VSYLAARSSRDLVVAAHQQVTREWWEQRRCDFELFVSALVVQEACSGDEQSAQRRLNELATIPVLVLTEEATALANDPVEGGPLPRTAIEDALHIALATVHGMDYLLTWKCRHLANAEMQHGVTAKCLLRGYDPPVICIPEELMGG
jgi:hypothetical protein